MEFGLKGKIAVITGGSSGIGKAIALLLTKEGAHVAICGRDPEKLRAAAGEIKKMGGEEPFAVQADVRRLIDIKSFVRQVIERYGRIDILVNNAGAMIPGAIDRLTDETWQDSIETKVFGFMRFIREVLPCMKQQNAGRIINIVGLSGKAPSPGTIASGVINAANLNLTKALADQLARYNILVNSVCPGIIDTPMSERNYREMASAAGTTIEEAKAARLRFIPLRRMGKAEEVASVAVFLASEKASYVTGASVNVDGGSGRYIV